MNIIIESKANDRNYLLICHKDSPLGEIHDALCQMKEYVLQAMKDTEKKEEEETTEEVELIEA